MHTPIATDGAGSARAGAALIALGAFAALVCLIYLSPFALSSYAIQNDVYMGNLFISAPLAVGAIICLVAGWLMALRAPGRQLRDPSMGMLAGRALLVALGGALLVAIAYAPLGGQYHSFGPTPIAWPPYLNAAVMAVTLLVGLAVLLVSLWWSASTRAR
jgi:hypothetical protein